MVVDNPVATVYIRFMAVQRPSEASNNHNPRIPLAARACWAQRYSGLMDAILNEITAIHFCWPNSFSTLKLATVELDTID